jgi:hypothetical protein
MNYGLLWFLFGINVVFALLNLVLLNWIGVLNAACAGYIFQVIRKGKRHDKERADRLAAIRASWRGEP